MTANYTSLDDKTLMVLVARGHTDAMSELYQRHSRLIYGLALNVVNNQQAAEEITLDVFTRAWQKADTYRSEQALVRTWLCVICRNRAINWLRRQKAHPEYNSLSWADVSPGTFPTTSSPEKITDATFMQEQVRAAVKQLPLEQRQALALAFFRGYTHSQIAQLLDQPLGTVKTRIRLGMQKLRHLLQETNEMA
jgi:RNA polymerase sigma-70 factor (ECF subfamily)